MKFAPIRLMTLLLVLMLATVQCFAAPSDPPPPTPPPPPGVPIDGNLVVLMVCAVVFALYKLHHIKKARI